MSRLFRAVGICQGDVMSVSQLVNSAQERLIMAKEAGDTGWWGSWAEVAFDVKKTDPYITLPRQFARIENVAQCAKPIPIQNQFYEYLRFGIGPQSPTSTRTAHSCQAQMFDRGQAVTFKDLDVTNGPQILRVYPGDANDINIRVFLQGLDQNGKEIFTQDGYNIVRGVFVNLTSPFVDAPMTFTKITGIQKDTTAGTVTINQADPNTGAESSLLVMEAAELVAGYRRYYLNNVPLDCCGTQPATGTAQNVQVKGMCKLEFIPAEVDTDYLIIQSLEALIAECQAIRYSEMDTQTAMVKEAAKHKDAIRFLQGQLVHELGRNTAAVSVKPFGSARLERVGIGMI